MNKLAAKALESYEDDDEGESNPFGDKAGGDSEDLETEMEAFLQAAGKKDTAAMAAAFQEACRLCK